MSTIFVKGELSRKKIMKIVLEDKNRMSTFEKSLNSRDFCIVCGKGREVDEESGMPLELIRHHVQYSPALVCYVHYECHRKIRNPVSAIQVLYLQSALQRTGGIHQGYVWASHYHYQEQYLGSFRGHPQCRGR